MTSYLTKWQAILAAMVFSIAVPVFAESAPVYDVDNLPQQFGNGGDQADDSDTSDAAPAAPQGAGIVTPHDQVVSGSISTSSMSMDQRLRRLEQQMTNLQTSSSAQRIEALQDQVQSLRGQVEQLTHQLEQAQTQQKAQFSDLDKRLSQQMSVAKTKAASKDVSAGITGDGSVLPPAPANKKPKTVTASNSPDTNVVAKGSKSSDDDGQPNVAEEQQIYQTAYNLIKAKKYDQAVTALQGMLQKYPSGQFASNAHYWLGELYGLMGKSDQALEEFDNVVTNYPDSPRLSDAQLKLGLIYAAESKWSDAKAAFKKVVNRYPGSAPARLASEQLKQIKEAGH